MQIWTRQGNAIERENAMKAPESTEQIKPVALVSWIEYNIVPIGVSYQRISYALQYTGATNMVEKPKQTKATEGE